MKLSYIFWIVFIPLIIVGVAFLVTSPGKPGKLDTFAQCLGEKGAVFYGAFWCPHCQNQKAMFGKSAKYLPYVECSTADGQDQLKVCTDKGVTTYPTWDFADGARLTGEVSLDKLAEETGCVVPQ